MGVRSFMFRLKRSIRRSRNLKIKRFFPLPPRPPPPLTGMESLHHQPCTRINSHPALDVIEFIMAPARTWSSKGLTPVSILQVERDCRFLPRHPGGSYLPRH